MHEYGERFGCAVLVFEFRNILLARLVLASAEHRRFGTGPAQLDVADLLARRAEPFAPRLFGTFDQATGGHEILHAGEAGTVLNFLQNDQGQNPANTGDRV